MKHSMMAVSKALIRGLLIVIPVYLAILLLLKGMKSVANLVRPFTAILPEWIPAEDLLSLLLVLAICALIGGAVVTRIGRGARDWIERTVFERIPGYGVIRSLTHQMAGKSQESTWRAALIEIEDALVPGFIIEEFEDGRYTVFVPSVPTPLAGAVYILERNRVHPLDVPFTQALQVVSRWGAGAKDLELAAARASNPSGADRTVAPGRAAASGEAAGA